MKGRVIVIDMPADRPSQAALIVDGRLEDLLIDPPRGDTTPKPGEIYWAKVDRVTQGGTFLKLTRDHNGFLRETKGVRQGQGLLVQITSYAEPGKATPVSSRLLYKGRRVIYTPNAPGINVSRQIKDPNEKDRLTLIVERAISAMARTPEGGVIIRSAAQGAEEDELFAETMFRLDSGDPESRMMPGPDPEKDLGLSHYAHSSDTAIREWTSPIPQQLIVPAEWKSILTVIEMPSLPEVPSHILQHSIELRTAATLSDADPFDHLGVWDEIERLRSTRADLPSGGWMAIEATRAMVTVDVNTGDGFGTGDAMTANIEAARELPRQLRLRGLGGQVIIDFAPLKKQHRKKIEETLKSAFRRDPVDTSLAGWTPLGNFELQRKRERRPLLDLLPD